jgi:hypothetical protein
VFLKSKSLLMVFGVAAWGLPIFVLAQTFSPEIKAFDLKGNQERNLTLASGVDRSRDFAVADVNNDLNPELIVCYGSGVDSLIDVYNLSGELLKQYQPYSKSFRGGCQVSAGDLNRDGQPEIVTGAGAGGSPQIAVLNGDKTDFFWAFDDKLRNGVRVLAADLGADGQPEIVAFSNYNQVAEVSLFGNDFHKINSAKLEGLNSNGLSVAVGDFNSDGAKEIAVAGGYGQAAQIRFYDLDFKLLKTLDYHKKDWSGGLNLAAADIDGDGWSELAVAEDFGGSGEVSFYDWNGRTGGFDAYPKDFTGGLNLKLADIDGDWQIEVVTLPASFGEALPRSDYKFITVDLKNQTLYRYQNGKVLDNFLISSGKAGTPTPVGGYSIYRKRPKVNMSGIGYSLPNVPWVASFIGPYTIHGTYWHDNFGHPMSHGCVNMRTPDAKTVYDWSEIGTKVIIFK